MRCHCTAHRLTVPRHHHSCCCCCCCEPPLYTRVHITHSLTHHCINDLHQSTFHLRRLCCAVFKAQLRLLEFQTNSIAQIVHMLKYQYFYKSYSHDSNHIYTPGEHGSVVSFQCMQTIIHHQRQSIIETDVPNRVMTSLSVARLRLMLSAFLLASAVDLSGYTDSRLHHHTNFSHTPQLGR